MELYINKCKERSEEGYIGKNEAQIPDGHLKNHIFRMIF